MKDSEAAEWRITRRKGACRYIFFSGILEYGLFLACINIFVIPIAKGTGFSDVLSLKSLFQLIISLLGGALFGLILWSFNEHRYKKK